MADIANKTESWSGHTLGEVESHIKSRLNTDESIVGFYTCGTAAAAAAKVVAAYNYVLTDGGSIKIKFTYANSVASPTLNINSTGAKAIVYNGAVASATNTWKAGDVVEFYYDPTYNSNVGAYVGIPTVVTTPEEFSQLGQQSVIKKSQVDLLDCDNLIAGKYDNNGILQESSGFRASPLIEVRPNTIYRIEGILGQQLGEGTCCYILFDEDKNQLSVNFTSQTRAQSITTTALTKYIAISFRKAALPIKLFISSLVDNPNITYNPIDGYTNMRQWDTIVTPTNNRKTSASIAAYSRIALTGFPWYLKKNVHITYYAEFSSFTKLLIGPGRSGDYSSKWLSISSSSVAIISYESQDQVLDEVSHNLTFSTYIKVILDINNDGSWHYIIMTRDGYYDHTYQTSQASFGVYSGNVFIQASAQHATTNVTLSATCDDLRKPIWIFGDSYISAGNNFRWPFHVRRWFPSAFNNFLLCGIPGGSTYGTDGNGKNTMADLKRCLYYGTPKYIMWFIGMNDGDNGDVVNTNWANGINELKTLCDTLHIELILATIPSTSLVNNAPKTNWIRNSGIRYIDFSKAVNGDIYTEGVDNWYSGYCYDGIHPTVLGAEALATQLVVDFPEILDTL